MSEPTEREWLEGLRPEALRGEPEPGDVPPPEQRPPDQERAREIAEARQIIADARAAKLDYLEPVFSLFDALATAHQQSLERERAWLEWSNGQYPDDSPGDVISAEPDGTIVLDDGITTWNPLRAIAYFAKRERALREEKWATRDRVSDWLCDEGYEDAEAQSLLASWFPANPSEEEAK